MRFLTRSETAGRFEGKSVAIVGGGPGALGNPAGLVDSHDVVVRVNDFKVEPGSGTGARTDVFYSFFGRSIRKPVAELVAAGVTLCMAKCPNARPIESDWHRRTGRMMGVDFRYIYGDRRDWWFCDTYVPTVAEFMVGFELLGRHIPTTGFSAILDVLSFEPASVFLTGFDFFASGRHNLDEPWQRGKNPDDPIKHVPEAEAAWLAENWGRHPLSGDEMLMRALGMERTAA